MSDEALNTGGSVGGDSGAVEPTGAESSPAAASSGPDTLDRIFDDAISSLGGTDTEEATAELAPEATAPAIEAQPEQAAVEPAPESPGEPPQERWDVILQNAREKTRDEVLQHVVQQYGPSLQVVEALKSDPVGTVTKLIEELQADPRFAQQMASHAARTLRAARQPAQVTEEPQADLEANGTLLFSAPQQAKREAWLKSQWTQELHSALAPIQQDLHQRQQAAQRTALRQQAAETIAAQLKPFADRPWFKENKEAIATKQQEYFHKLGGDGNEWVALSLAMDDVRSQVSQVESAKQQQQLVASAAQKLRAATPNPSTTAPAASRKARDINDAFELAIQEHRG